MGQGNSELLERRGRALARPRKTRVGDRELAISVTIEKDPVLISMTHVLGIAPLRTMTPIPSPDPNLAGLIAYRGTVLFLYRLMAPVERRGVLTEWDRVVIVGRQQPELALWVLSVNGTRQFRRDDLKPAPRELTADLAPLVVGVTSDQELVVDVAPLLEISSVQADPERHP